MDGHDWPAIVGIALSAGGIAATIAIYVRSGRKRPDDAKADDADADADGHAPLGIGAAARKHFRSAAASVTLRADGAISRHRSRRRDQDRSMLAEILPFDEEASVVKELERRRPEYTLEEVAAYYEAMADEDLPLAPDDDSGAA
jgi:hypothetical protein